MIMSLYHVCFSDPACDDDWISNELIDSCFKVELEELTFSKAAEVCRDQGAELVHSYNLYYTVGELDIFCAIWIMPISEL